MNLLVNLLIKHSVL